MAAWLTYAGCRLFNGNVELALRDTTPEENRAGKYNGIPSRKQKPMSDFTKISAGKRSHYFEKKAGRRAPTSAGNRADCGSTREKSNFGTLGVENLVRSQVKICRLIHASSRRCARLLRLRISAATAEIDYWIFYWPRLLTLLHHLRA